MKSLATIAALALAVLTAGCSTSPHDLEAKVTPEIRVFGEQYQEIYRRVSSTARRCIAGNISGYASFAVDADLYSDLHYGEVTMSLINIGIRNYYLSAKVEKADRGSRMTVSTGNTLGATNLAQSVQRWANGDPNC